MCIDEEDNELEVLEMIHHFVEILDQYFGSVSSIESFEFRKYCFIYYRKDIRILVSVTW